MWKHAEGRKPRLVLGGESPLGHPVADHSVLSPFPLVGTKAHDFELFAEAAELLGKDNMADTDYRQVLLLREQMNRGGKRRYTTERILRDYTPSSPANLAGEMR